MTCRIYHAYALMTNTALALNIPGCSSRGLERIKRTHHNPELPELSNNFGGGFSLNF